MNQRGNLTSDWSNAVLNEPRGKPTSPTDLKILDSYSTGFQIQFREPVDFKGYLSHYLIYIQPLTLLEADQSRILVSPAVRKCKTPTQSPNQTILSVTGLASFKSYRVSVSAVNSLGNESILSENIVANTIESGPEGLLPLGVIVETRRAIFKFTDPESPNGFIKRFNLYKLKRNSFRPLGKRVYFDYELLLVYSGTSREFVYDELEPFKNYEFLYEVCSVLCTRQLESLEIVTLESEPEYQLMPIVTRLMPFLNCFRINWTLPLKPNGRILNFTIIRSSTSAKRFEPTTETIIAKIIANLVGMNFSFLYLIKIN